MKLKLPILLLALAFPAGQAALAQEPPQSVDATALKLDSFVRDAISEGLLSPAGTGPAAGRALSQPQPQDVRPPSPAPGLRLRPKQSFEQNMCGDANPLDFSEFNEFVGYDDLVAWRGASGDRVSKLQLAKAYLALGLNEEARSELIGVEGRDAVALREFAHLMEGRRAPNVRYFQDLKDCYADASIWLMTAQLASNEQAGVTGLADHLNTVRRLPLQLRITFANVAIPALDRLNQTLLSEKLMAVFTEGQIATSTRLTFAKAVADLGAGSQIAEAQLRQLFASSRFRDEAASTLRRHGYHITADYETQFVARLVDDYGKLPTDIPVELSLDLLLRDLNDSADYDMTLQLARLPAAQTDEARARLAGHFVELADKDLQSPESLRNLEAMDALLKSGDLLEGYEDRARLYGAAAALAVHLGLRNLAETLADEVEADEVLNFAEADLAYRLSDLARLEALADEHPDNARITQLAALSAIETGRTDRLSTYERRLPQTAEMIVPLIEADAARGDWVVSDDIYRAARAIEDEAFAPRVARVIALKPDAEKSAATAGRMELAEVPGNLDRIARSLDAPETEMR